MSAETVLGGALRRVGADVWVWADTGVRERRVRDLRLADLAPNYRCVTMGSRTYVEVPDLWRQDVDHPDVEEALTRLLASHGRRAHVYAEGLAEALDDHRVVVPGWLVPIEAWSAEMGRVMGACWHEGDQEDLLARAAECLLRRAAECQTET